MRTTRSVLGALLAVAALSAAPCAAREQKGTVTFAIDVQAPGNARNVKLWFPYPTSTSDQTISSLKFSGNYSRFTMAREPRSGALYLYTEWTGGVSDPALKVSFHAAAKERRRPRLAESNGPVPAEVRRYVESEFWIPSDDARIVAMARKITAGRAGYLAKARAVYDWVVANTRRDPDVPGCGVGDVHATLASRTGKCADITSVFVALARAAGVPAREVFGLRLGRAGQTDITDGHHCWAEFYLPGTGWIPVDPADVRKIMLARKLDLPAAKPHADYYFGNVDEYRIVLQTGGRSIAFPEGNAGPLNYFMYPYAEVDGKPLDYCQPKTFRYSIRFVEG